MSIKILSMIFLALSLFLGETVPAETDVKATGLIDEETKVVEETFSLGENYYYAKITEEGDDHTVYTKLNSSDSIDDSGFRYAIIVPTELGSVSVDGYDDISFEAKYLEDQGESFYYSTSSINSPNYLVFEFNPRYKVNSMSATGINMNAGDKLTEKALLKFDVENADIGTDEIQVECTYYYADKFDEFFEDHDIIDENNVDEFNENVVVKEEKLEAGKRYYVSVGGLYTKDFSCLTEPNYDLPDSNSPFGRSKDFSITINGKKASILNITIDALEPETTEVALTKVMALTYLTSGRYYIEFVANEATKQTDLEYKVQEEYEWVISSATQADVNGKIIDVLTDKNDDENVEVNVTVNKWALEKGNTLNITVDSLNDWNMVDQSNPSNMLPYVIATDDGDGDPKNDIPWDEENSLITLEGIGEIKMKSLNAEDSEPIYYNNGIFAWNGPKPKWAGTYKDTLTFTAEIVSPQPPKTGEEIIIVGDVEERKYKVLEVNGNEATLIALYDVTSNNGNLQSMQFHRGSVTLEAGGFFGSDLDVYLNGDYYNSLSFKDAIVGKNIVCSLYTNDDPDLTIGSSDYTIFTSEPQERCVYAFDLSDIIKYLGTTTDNIQVYNTFSSKASTSNNFYWTRSSYYANPTSTWKVAQQAITNPEFTQGCILSTNATSYPVRPMFVVDTSKLEWVAVAE